MKIGMVLEGGAMRGLFTAGVNDVLMTHGFQPDGMIGVSAGAAFGCNYKSNQPRRVLRYNVKYCKDPRYGSVRSWIKTGDFYGGDFCYHTLPFELDLFDTEAFRSNPMEFYVVCTDANTGKAVYHPCSTGTGEDLEWIRASASMPILSKEVVIQGNPYLDGGCSDSIPLKYFESIGYEKNIVVLTQPRGYQKRTSKLIPMMKPVLRKYPKLVEALANRAEEYNQSTAYVFEQERKGNVLVIAPMEDLRIGKAENDPDELRRVYEIGRRTGLKELERIFAFCGD